MQNCSKNSSIPEQAVLGLIAAYRVVAGPVKISLGLHGCCRFNPSCSHYAQQAISTHGLATGGMLSIQRLMRCHPWGESGYDPVPQTKNPSDPQPSNMADIRPTPHPL